MNQIDVLMIAKSELKFGNRTKFSLKWGELRVGVETYDESYCATRLKDHPVFDYWLAAQDGGRSL